MTSSVPGQSWNDSAPSPVIAGIVYDPRKRRAPATDGTSPTEPATTDGTPATNSISPNGQAVLVTEPTPQEMCPEGSWPRAAAYEIDAGAFQWATCTINRAWQSVIHTTDEAIYLWPALPDPNATLALDPRTGEELASAPPPPREAFGNRSGAPIVVEVDGARVTGSQEGPIRVRLEDGTSWTQPGRWAYDDTYAVGDDAVFAIEREPTRLVAYELETGDVRWAHEGDATIEGLWPRTMADGRLYTLWFNLQVRSTTDGTLIWATNYPVDIPPDGYLDPSPDAPRMSGVAVGDDVVYVSFATQAAGGD